MKMLLVMATVMLAGCLDDSASQAPNADVIAEVAANAGDSALRSGSAGPFRVRGRRHHITPVTTTNAPTTTLPASPATPAIIGTASLSWLAPTQNTDGSPLTDLAGYRVYYGTSSSNMSQAVSISTVATTSYVVGSLGAGTWYFAVRSFNAAGVESESSNLASKTIT